MKKFFKRKNSKKTRNKNQNPKNKNSISQNAGVSSDNVAAAVLENDTASQNAAVTVLENNETASQDENFEKSEKKKKFSQKNENSFFKKIFRSKKLRAFEKNLFSEDEENFAEEKKSVSQNGTAAVLENAAASGDKAASNPSPSLSENFSIPKNSAEASFAPPPLTQNSIHTLRANSLYKSFGKKQVVKGVDFFLNTGEVLGLLGPNGSGKTTSFYMIIGFYKPTRGEVFLDKSRITSLPMFKRAQMGISYLPQEPSVFRKLTVEENIWSILERRRDLTRSQKKATLEELIEEFSITKIRRQYAYTLSGGERRRTEIARSLAINPKFLLLDEPFAGIDPIAVADLKKMISLLKNRGIGILITDHNVRDTLEITDRAIIIYNGEIVTQGSRDEILGDDKARRFYLGEEFSM